MDVKAIRERRIEGASFLGPVWSEDMDALFARIEELEQELIAEYELSPKWRAMQERVRVLEEALTPSGATKAAFIGEFEFELEGWGSVGVPWTTIKEIMAAIRARALSTERMPSDG